MMLKRNVKTGIGVILFVIFSFFTFASDPFLKVNIKEVSMFKNGYAFVVAEADVPGPGIYALPEFPGVVYGTLWITPESDSLKVKQIFKDTETTTHTNTTYHILHVLEKGIGKTFDLKLQSEGWLTAEILGTAGDEYLYAKTDKGVLIIKKQEILGLRLKDTKAIEDMKRVETRSNTAIRNKVEVTQGKGTLKIRFLSQGMTWAPSYLVDIRDSGEAVISCKSLLLNTLEDVTEAKGFLIAGFPNIAFLSQEDPFTGGDVANVLQMGNYNARNLQSQTMYTQQNIASNVANFSEPVNNTAAIETGEMNADLYFFPVESLSIKKNQKKYLELFKKRVPFRDGYTWSIENNFDQEYCRFRNAVDSKQNQEVWHTIELTNTSGIPWTTAPVLVIDGDKIMGQDTLSFTNIAGKSLIKITRPLDITAQLKESEVERLINIDRAKYPRYHYHSSYNYDLVTIAGQMAIVNRKATPITMTIKKLIYGEIMEIQNKPKIEKPAWDLDKENLPHLITWEITVALKDKAVVDYKYRVLIRR